MRTLLYFFIGLSICGCHHTHYVKIADLVGYINVDGSKNVYCVDTCFKIDMDSFVIIKSLQRKHAFVVPSNLWVMDSFSEKNVIESPSCFILGYEMASSHSACLFARTIVTPRDYAMLGDTWSNAPQLIPSENSLSKDSYREYLYHQTPSYFHLLLIRKDVYKMITRCGSDCIPYSILDFSSYDGYVKLVVPVWKEK